MRDINEKFKDMPPEETVQKIQGILAELGIELEERWNDSGLENCWSLHVFAKGAYPMFTNGKGVSKALARASAYGEFIERLQCGLFLYKFQSITRDPAMNLQMFAPDGKYMTTRELVENGEWMDHVIRTYGGGLTREKLAAQCRIYACTQEDKIWTIPFYSLFEDKYVYLPAGFVEHIYSANGCCAGNSREEAWIHACSEMMERRSTIAMLTGGTSAPRIPDEVLNRFPTVANILKAVRANGRYDVQVLDFSIHKALPAVATRIIDKKKHSYFVDVSADPVLEIALCRTLTESFQGRKLDDFGLTHSGETLEEVSAMPKAHNILNQIERGNGMFSAAFFTESEDDKTSFEDYGDHSGKTNKELLEHVLGVYREMGRPLYVRNYSFLGFNSYQLVVPGFSEARGFRLVEPISEYALGDSVYRAFRDVESASPDDLVMMMAFYGKMGTVFSRKHNFRGLAGLPLEHTYNALLTVTALSSAAYRLGRYAQARDYITPVLGGREPEPGAADYFSCVHRYLGLKAAKVPEEKIRCILNKFCEADTIQKLYDCLDNGKLPLDPYLMRCDTVHCAQCRYQKICSYERCKQLIARAGEKYRAFANGQDRKYLSV